MRGGGAGARRSGIDAVNEKRTEQKKQSSPEAQRKQAERQSKAEREQEPFDEQSLDDVLRDCPL